MSAAKSSLTRVVTIRMRYTVELFANLELRRDQTFFNPYRTNVENRVSS